MSGFTVLGPDWAARAQGVLRIIAGFLFLQHATAKLFGIPHVAYFDNLQLFSLVGFAGVIELIGAPLLMVGLFTRPVAFILSGEMAAAYFIGHASQGHFFAPSLNQGEPAVLYCFVFLFFAAAGPGAWSLDSLREKRLAASGDGVQHQHSR
jgi:putative oxidoreductase